VPLAIVPDWAERLTVGVPAELVGVVQPKAARLTKATNINGITLGVRFIIALKRSANGKVKHLPKRLFQN
jgi:hypothetical protein